MWLELMKTLFLKNLKLTLKEVYYLNTDCYTLRNRPRCRNIDGEELRLFYKEDGEFSKFDQKVKIRPQLSFTFLESL